MDRKNSLTKYDQMVLEMQESIGLRYFVLAGFLSWLMLAGLLVSPSTYSSVRFHVIDQTGDIARVVVSSLLSIPLLCIALFLCVVATIGLVWLWWKMRRNHIWVSNQIIM